MKSVHHPEGSGGVGEATLSDVSFAGLGEFPMQVRLSPINGVVAETGSYRSPTRPVLSLVPGDVECTEVFGLHHTTVLAMS